MFDSEAKQVPAPYECGARSVLFSYLLSIAHDLMPATMAAVLRLPVVPICSRTLLWWDGCTARKAVPKCFKRWSPVP